MPKQMAMLFEIPKCSRECRARGFQVGLVIFVTVVFGTTALLKGYSLFIDPAGLEFETGIPNATLMFGMVVELLLVGLLVTRLPWKVKRAAMVCVFAGFSGFALVRSFIGTGYCGCAGSWRVPSVLFLGIDLVLVVILCLPWLKATNTIAEDIRHPGLLDYIDSIGLLKCTWIVPCTFALAALTALNQFQVYNTNPAPEQVLIDQVLVSLYGQDYRSTSLLELDVLWVDQKCMHCRERISQVFTQRGERPVDVCVPLVVAGASQPPFSAVIPVDFSGAILIHIGTPIAVRPGTLLRIRRDGATLGSSADSGRLDWNATHFSQWKWGLTLSDPSGSSCFGRVFQRSDAFFNRLLCTLRLLADSSTSTIVFSPLSKGMHYD